MGIKSKLLCTLIIEHTHKDNLEVSKCSAYSSRLLIAFVCKYIKNKEKFELN